MLPRALRSIPLLIAAFVAAAPLSAEGKILMRVSVENVGAHFQAQTLRRFSGLVASGSRGALEVEFRDGAQLFRDADVIAALSRGDVEFAAPGIWQFDKIAPDSAAFMLPSVYGRPTPELRALMSGPLGDLVSRRIEESAGVRVLGPWLDLGYAHIFSMKPIRSVADLKGTTVRVAGGRGNEERMSAFGASPVAISSADLPAYLDRGAVGAVLTTYETVDSAGLDAHGLKAVFEDREYYPFYVPVASSSFWSRLSAGQRKLIEEAWAESLAENRDSAAAAQETAKARLVSRGMKVVAPPASELVATRASLAPREEGIAMRLGISPEALALLRSGLPR